jgi:hypothetical protein
MLESEQREPVRIGKSCRVVIDRLRWRGGRVYVVLTNDMRMKTRIYNKAGFCSIESQVESG